MNEGDDPGRTYSEHAVFKHGKHSSSTYVVTTLVEKMIISLLRVPSCADNCCRSLSGAMMRSISARMSAIFTRFRINKR